MESSSQSSANISVEALQKLDHVLQRLSPQQIILFDLIAVLGEADWSHNMIAAVALRVASEVKQDLAELVARGLIDPVSTERYRVTTLVRKAAKQRFHQWEPYQQRAACAVFGAYCLSRVQAYLQDAERDARVSNHEALDSLDGFFIQAFRDRIMPEMSHIRQALAWSEYYQLWDVFLRFASVAFLDLLFAPGTNDLKQYAALQMATLYRPTLTKGDLNTLLSSCDIVDGVCTGMFLPDAKWTGVRAPRLLLQDVDMVDSQLRACDLSDGVWVRCDAQKAIIADCDFTNTLFKDVRLYKVHLTDVTLVGAVLTRVNLRDAIMQNADLRGAVLYDVDLRGADLRGANLDGIAARRINLQECLLEDTSWSDASIEELIVDDETTRQVIEERMKVPNEAGLARASDAADELERLEHAEQRTNELQEQWEDVEEIDLRTANLIGITLQDADFHDADLRAIVLSQATLPEANLRGAQLQAAQLVGANLRGADLSQVNLRAADLHHSILSSATLACADASFANLQYARLDAANFHMANLSHADLFQADVTGADLDKAICTGANLCDSKMTHAQLLQVARLDEATLPDGRIVARLNGYYANSDALDSMFLQFAFCDGRFLHIDLTRAEMSGAQLVGGFSHITLVEADLTNARLGGNFSHCDFKGALLVRARISGSFYEVDWRESNLSQADLTGARLINADLTGTALTEVQLCQAYALRGTLLPDGSMYDGRYHLPVDIDTARNLGYNPDDPIEMAEFCGNRKPTFNIR